MRAPLAGRHRDDLLERRHFGVAPERAAPARARGAGPGGSGASIARYASTGSSRPAQTLRAERLVADRRARRRVRGGPDDHLARLAPSFCEPLRGVDDVAHHGRVAAGPHRADEHLAGVHPDAHLHADAEVGRERGERLVHAQRGAHRPFGVVLVGDGRAEQGHDLVADDLVEVAAEVDDVGDERLEARVDQALHLLGVARRPRAR